ncbi:MAG: WS/DGAT/MGAT family O-acyltransferase [Labedaea sp.]
MADRLSALDASFLYLEERSAPLHVGSVAVFRRPRSGFEYGRMCGLIERQLTNAPRYRQKIVPVPAQLARPVWVDDPDFDLTYHVRRSALPRPGNEEQLLDLVARLMSRPLDHARPLWEVYLVEGLARGHVALVTKTHQALVDGVRTVDIGQLILATSAYEPEQRAPHWLPGRPPGRPALVLDAVRETVRRPAQVIENARSAAVDAASTARRVAGAMSGLLAAIGDVARPAAAGPLNVPIGSQRRFAVARADLDDLRRCGAEHGGTVHDVVLAVVAGALRAWLLSRGEPVTSSTTLRALVPLAVSAAGDTVTPYLVDLPVGEPNPFVRLQHIGHAMRAHTDSARSVAADALLRAGAYSPATLHALGARAATSFAKRIFNLVITYVPGPQRPLYAGTAQLTEVFPVVPLIREQALAVGVTSYDGGVYFGLTGDRDAMSDVDTVAKMVAESVDELLTTPRRS